MTADIEAATRFIHTSGRLLERHRLAHLLHGGDPEPVLRTLRAYRNDDGGFGNAIEPDMRAPDSQPVGIHTAMEILHEVGATDDPMIAPAADWLGSITRPDGGVPFCLPSVLDHPRNPIWQPADSSSIIQTAANAAALHRLGVRHPWLDGASDHVWRWLDALDLEHVEPTPGTGYEVRFAVVFLNAVPDAARAEAALGALAPGLLASGLVATEPGDTGDVQTPLDLAPEPGDRARRMFDQSTIDGHVQALADAQHEDGGWMFGWDQWSEAATIEWRGVLTVNAVRVLRANMRA
jgi:hypothetical protein